MSNKLLFTTFFSLSIFISKPVFSQETKTPLERFVEKKRNFNKKTKNGFSVVLYTGNEGIARETFENFKTEFQDIKIKLTYVSPDWKVITPSCSSKIEAERIVIAIKEKYPTAKIL